MIYTSSQLIAGLISQYPEVCTHGFRRAIHALMPADEHEDEWPIVDFIPDAYSILPSEREIHLFEVEITHALTRDKRDSIAIFAEEMTSYDWRIGIQIVNRYGHITSLEWFPMYPDWLKRQASEVVANGSDVEEIRRLLGL